MQLEFFDVPSPCIGICQSDDKGQCLGCFRTRDERLKWTSTNSDERQKIIKRCQQRKKRKSAPSKVKIAEIEIVEKQPSLLDPPTKSKIESNDDFDFGDFEL
jgi:predicted Fe-S protein YdhL (DUF1289 family)